MALAPFFLLKVSYNSTISVSVEHPYLKAFRKVSNISYIIIKQ
jgi:hypothetical protein